MRFPSKHRDTILAPVEQHTCTYNMRYPPKKGFSVTKTVSNTAVSADGLELVPHGTEPFPVEVYELDLPTYTVPWHWHGDWEYVLCTGNRTLCRTPEGDIVLDPGYGLFIGPRMIHEVTAASTRSSIRSIVFDPRFVASESSIIWEKYVLPVAGMGTVKLHPDNPWQWDVMHEFCNAWHYMDQEAPGYEIQSRQALENALYLLSGHAELRRASTSEKARRSTERLELMLHYIERHFGERLTVGKIAASASVSESECLRCFRSVLRTTPNRYLREYRLLKAEELLVSTTDTAADIAAVCGFSDAAYFTKLFREAKGATPIEYRRDASRA